MALIELRDVTKSYKRDAIEIPVLDRVSITVESGDFMGLMGPSGSGKSTLLNLLAGIDRPSRGSITIGGTEISSLSERALAAWRARHIGFIFQLYNLIPVLTAFENVELPLLLTRLSKTQRRDLFLQVLEFLLCAPCRVDTLVCLEVRHHRTRLGPRLGGAARVGCDQPSHVSMTGRHGEIRGV